MKEGPILFSGTMVRALLDGSKTQTRRVVKLPHQNPLGEWQPTTVGGEFGGRLRTGETIPLQGAIWHTRTGDCLMSPHGGPGDQLYVRETHRPVASGTVKSGYGEVRYGVAYQADGHVEWNATITKVYDLSGQPDTGPMQFQPPPWKPSIHMARRYSRIALEVTGVRVERLQDISYEDAISEGIHDHAATCPDDRSDETPEQTARRLRWPQRQYENLWNSLNAPRGYGWDINPWVWVVEFKRIKP